MKEIRNIISTYHQIDWTKEQVALATVVSVEESAYRRIGARMLVRSSGVWIGGISGGCLEGDALKRARIAIMNKKPSIVVYDTLEDDDHQIGVGLGCNGRIEVLFTPIDPEDKSNPIEQLIAIHQSRKPSIFYQVLNKQNEAIFGLFGKGSNKAEFSQKLEIRETALEEKTGLVLERKKSKVFNFESPNGRLEVLIEFIRPELKIVLVGDNYDVNAFSGIANELGWEIHVVGLQRKLNKSIFKLAKQVIHYDQVQELEIDDYTVIVLMSHDYKWDLQVLKVFLEKNPPYIGMLGPKKRTLKMKKELEEEHQISFDIDNLHFLHSPIGLDIGAETPEEIALSAAAEIVAHFRNRNGQFLRLREGTIYERE